MAISPIELDPTNQRAETRGAARRDRASNASEPEGSVVSASDPASVAAAVAANRAITIDERSIEFSYDDEIDRVIVKVRSSKTDEIVRQIPPKEYVQFLSRFKEAIGVLFDEVA